MLNEKDPKHLGFKRKLRKIGLTCLGIGIICDLIGLVSFLSVFTMPNNPFEMKGPSPLFGLLFIGMPLTFVGLVCTIYSYMGEVSRYSATEVAPVAKDTINYMVDGTKESLQTVVGAIHDGIKGNQSKTIKCHHCNGDNHFEAKFCNYCGKAIINHKTCSQCQAKNELDAVFCNKCGTKFNK